MCFVWPSVCCLFFKGFEHHWMVCAVSTSYGVLQAASHVCLQSDWSSRCIVTACGFHRNMTPTYPHPTLCLVTTDPSWQRFAGGRWLPEAQAYFWRNITESPCADGRARTLAVSKGQSPSLASASTDWNVERRASGLFPAVVNCSEFYCGRKVWKPSLTCPHNNLNCGSWLD